MLQASEALARELQIELDAKNREAQHLHVSLACIITETLRCFHPVVV